MKWFAAVALALALAGCSPNVTAAQAEEEVLNGYSKYLKEHNETQTIRKVVMVKTSGTEFSGTVEMSDNSTRPVSATTDGRSIVFNVVED